MSDSGDLSARSPTMCLINSDSDCNPPSDGGGAAQEDSIQGRLPGSGTGTPGKVQG